MGRKKEMLYEAIAKVQDKVGEINVDQEANTGSSRSWNFASLKTIVNAIADEMKDNKLVVSHRSTTVVVGASSVFGVRTRITHAPTGAYIQTFGSNALRDPSNVQECGTKITYWRRYNLQMLLNLRINKDIEDTDGEQVTEPKIALNDADELLLAELTMELNQSKTQVQIAAEYKKKQKRYSKMGSFYQERLKSNVNYIMKDLPEEKVVEKKDEAA